MHEPLKPVAVQGHKLKRAGLIGIAAVVVVVGLGATTRIFAKQELTDWTAEQATPTVSAFHPTMDGGQRTLSLPGSVEAWSQAPVFARTNGYLKAWYADIGTQVKAGEVLAEIDTPDVDQQVEAATADLATAQAQLKLADTTARRWDRLVAQDAVSKQDAEQKRSDLAVKRAMANAALANVDRLRTLQGFRRIVAPFDGVVTGRATDVGALIASGNAAARPLFTVADMAKMRIYVHVPQIYSANIKPDMSAKLVLPEYPGRTFEAKLAGTSQSVNDTTGSMLVQLVAENPEGLLKPGSYAQVSFDLPSSGSAVLVPASALLFRPQGMTVALIDGSGRVKLKVIKIARDDGAKVEIASGLSPSDLVVDSPPDALADGDQVRVLDAKDQVANARS
ncbi:efflux RND transporter periplasmic adaptor subunit [Parvibaculum sp.]|uniref:efflux RND transporter periplasmic adaptor subunit n=1 Tax=Parvibaculum sp. TaxID=2024848 RepID=UPI002BFD61BB|nr:efflux RND transporter periplasmic adaptor subunit [Parvibaculum sp.]HUD52529.1 efflux RND transporter periplasmic adaptor subunit [Parvibaculum sp.]